MKNIASPDALRALFQKKLWILDMDGTVYLGSSVFPETLPFLSRIKQTGAEYLFFTNNASRSKETYVKRLAALGIPASESQILTSGETMLAFLKKERPGKMVYLVGTPDLEKKFREAGISLYNDWLVNNGYGSAGTAAAEAVPSKSKAAKPLPCAEEEVSLCPIVVASFDTTLTYEKLNIACRLIRRGAEFFSTHPDFNCPVTKEEGDFVPDSGAICALITASTGKKPRYFGKPYEDVVRMIEAHTGLDRSDMVVVGDRLYTDIAVGVNNGMDAVLVLSGESTMEDVAASEVEPTYIVENIGKLL
ncbi:MAG: HAD-IIA family hydrolase [Firmicutes bacterium]|nr:HAD-IIA family hydrolase [Bacillota bacterium]